MKTTVKHLFLIALTAMPLAQALAQTKAIEVRYTMRVLPSEETLAQVPEELREAVIDSYESRISEHTLYCNQGFYAYATEDNPIKNNSFITKGDYAYCIDLQQQLCTTRQELDGKKYIITSPHKPLEWKIGKEEKMILGRRCTKATNDNAVAWFAEDLPFPSGPLNYNGLPGLILEIATSNGVSIIATKLSDAPADLTIVPPTDGQKVSQKEFDTITDKFLKALGVDKEQSKGKVIRIVRQQP